MDLPEDNTPSESRPTGRLAVPRALKPAAKSPGGARALTGQHALHPLASTFAELSIVDREALHASLATSGQLVPILRHGGLVVDGRERLRWCISEGVEPRFEELPEDSDPLDALLAANLQRRHLTRSQRAMAAARVATLDRGRPKKGQRCTFTVEEAARRFNISARLVKAARAVLRRRAPALVDVVERGLVSVSRGELLTMLDEDALLLVFERVSRALSGGDRATIVRDALEAAGLVAPEGFAEHRRTKDSLEILAAHVREADEPAEALEVVVADLARQAGLLLRGRTQPLVAPTPEANVAGVAGGPPNLALVGQEDAPRVARACRRG